MYVYVYVYLSWENNEKAINNLKLGCKTKLKHAELM